MEKCLSESPPTSSTQLRERRGWAESRLRRQRQRSPRNGKLAADIGGWRLRPQGSNRGNEAWPGKEKGERERSPSGSLPMQGTRRIGNACPRGLPPVRRLTPAKAGSGRFRTACPAERSRPRSDADAVPRPAQAPFPDDRRRWSTMRRRRRSVSKHSVRACAIGLRSGRLRLACGTRSALPRGNVIAARPKRDPRRRERGGFKSGNVGAKRRRRVPLLRPCARSVMTHPPSARRKGDLFPTIQRKRERRIAPGIGSRAEPRIQWLIPTAISRTPCPGIAPTTTSDIPRAVGRHPSGLTPAHAIDENGSTAPSKQVHAPHPHPLPRARRLPLSESCSGQRPDNPAPGAHPGVCVVLRRFCIHLESVPCYLDHADPIEMRHRHGPPSHDWANLLHAVAVKRSRLDG